MDQYNNYLAQVETYGREITNFLERETPDVSLALNRAWLMKSQIEAAGKKWSETHVEIGRLVRAAECWREEKESTSAKNSALVVYIIVSHLSGLVAMALWCFK